MAQMYMLMSILLLDLTPPLFEAPQPRLYDALSTPCPQQTRPALAETLNTLLSSSVNMASHYAVLNVCGAEIASCQMSRCRLRCMRSATCCH